MGALVIGEKTDDRLLDLVKNNIELHTDVT